MLTRRVHALKINRVAKGFTLDTLAEASGIHRLKLHKIETYKRTIREGERRILARILSTSPDTLR